MQTSLKLGSVNALLLVELQDNRRRADKPEIEQGAFLPQIVVITCQIVRFLLPIESERFAFSTLHIELRSPLEQLLLPNTLHAQLTGCDQFFNNVHVLITFLLTLEDFPMDFFRHHNGLEALTTCFQERYLGQMNYHH